jgi:signal transduction histidine kinase
LNETLEQRVAERSSEAIERAERLRILSGELTSAEETERRRIAEILHDDLQQMLVAARMQFLVLNKAADAGKRREIARESEDLLDRSFNLTRSLIGELAPPVLHECGLAAALESLGTQTKNRHHMHITVKADSSANPKDPSLNIFLFRAVRELLLNAMKHTNGRPVRVTMTRLRPNNCKLLLPIKDRASIPVSSIGATLSQPDSASSTSANAWPILEESFA